MTEPPEVIVVSTACGAQEEAARIARALVDARLAACVQILPIRSVYRWQGEVRDEPEWLLLIKARRADWPSLESAIRAAHSYQTPEILALDAAAGHAPYLDWIMAETSAETSAAADARGSAK
jgi:periplasmic divalent cation tolerance protein